MSFLLKRTILSSAVFLCCVFMLTSCGTPSGNFETSVRNGDYLDAIEIYNRDIIGNSNRENECHTFLADYLEESWDSYIDGSMDDRTFYDIITTLNKLDEQQITAAFLYGIQEKYDVVKESKANYAQGLAYMEEEDYLRAADSFRAVSVEDEVNYGDAQEKISEAMDSYQNMILESAEKAMQGGNYDIAFTIVTEAEDIMGATDQLERCLEKIYNDYYQILIGDAYDSSDYTSVIYLYNQAKQVPYVTVTLDMTGKYSSSVVAYTDELIEQARNIFAGDNDYLGALAFLDDGCAAVFSDEAVMAKLNPEIETYRSYVPVGLDELSPLTGDDWYVYNSVNDNFGTTHYHALGSSFFDDDTRVYNLSGEYKRIKGTLFIREDAKNSAKWATSFEIYGDDRILCGTSLVAGNEPYTFDLDISGVDRLKIYYTWMASASYTDGFAALGECFLYKH